MSGNAGPVLSEIRERVVRVETKMDDITETKEIAKLAAREAAEALQSVKAAQQMLLDVQDNQKWLWRVVIGGVVAAIISFILKGG
ncbi:hemolysin XhlA family protein [Paenibacillus soyae]|uniref:Hemolysin XhlA family protein n=1 Tax=Paenibacillus soyae TaxID=2969249 RepID=A0A9X2MQ87_9BACL|nr:hemolysin XhlA family protein [Paenibacillus soyae]MCR2804209.1 hemolysin XhlA family protein [Paenibacillus soyae]